MQARQGIRWRITSTAVNPIVISFPTQMMTNFESLSSGPKNNLLFHITKCLVSSSNAPYNMQKMHVLKVLLKGDKYHWILMYVYEYFWRNNDQPVDLLNRMCGAPAELQWT